MRRFRTIIVWNTCKRYNAAWSIFTLEVVLVEICREIYFDTSQHRHFQCICKYSIQLLYETHTCTIFIRHSIVVCIWICGCVVKYSRLQKKQLAMLRTPYYHNSWEITWKKNLNSPSINFSRDIEFMIILQLGGKKLNHKI